MLISSTLFLLGVYLSMRVIAALYRILDLWYTIGTAYPKVVRGILGWVGTAVAIAALVSDRHRPAFLWGFAAFVAFFLSLHVLLRLLLRKSFFGGKGGSAMESCPGSPQGRPPIREEERNAGWCRRLQSPQRTEGQRDWPPAGKRLNRAPSRFGTADRQAGLRP